MVVHKTKTELNAGVETIKNSPKDHGVLEECPLSAKLGVHGDFWAETCWSTLPDGSPNPDVQVTLMNSRCIALLAQEKSRWPLAGDQLYVDLDLSSENLPAGQRLRIGTAVLEITAVPHTDCRLFVERYGAAAAQFVNSEIGKQLHLRGIYARVVQDGLVKTQDRITKIA